MGKVKNTPRRTGKTCLPPSLRIATSRTYSTLYSYEFMITASTSRQSSPHQHESQLPQGDGLTRLATSEDYSYYIS